MSTDEPITYSTLTAEGQQAMIDERIRGFEAEHFRHHLDEALVVDLPREDPSRGPALARARDAQRHLARAIEICRAERAELDSPEEN